MATRLKVPAYSLHKRSGRAVVKIKQRSIYLGKHGSDESHEAYARIIADLLAGREIQPPAQLNQGNRTLVSSVSIGQLIERFQAHADGYYRKNGKPTSEPGTIRSALRYIPDALRGLPAAEFSIGNLKAIRQTMIDAGHCRSSINKNTNRVILVFRWAATEELIPPAIPQALALLPGLKAGRSEARESKPVEPVDDALVTKTLRELSPIVAAMVQLQRLTGMRPNEVCQVRPCDVDRSGKVWTYAPAEHKTEHHGKGRVILIGPRGQDILRPYLLRPHGEYCFRPSRGTLNPTKDRRYRVDSYRQAIERACDRAHPAPKGMAGEQLKAWRTEHRWSPNRLRHTFATEARAAYGLEAAQVLLGHSSADVTQIYAERDLSRGLEVAAKIG